MKKQLDKSFADLASAENLLQAWKEFLPGKKKKPDVQEFSFALMDNILSLRFDCINTTYRHGGYHHFKIADPKPRDIHKASVRDRLLHHAIYRILYPFFDTTFIADSFSCRIGKGTHKAINRFRSFAYRVSRNHTRTCWVLKCDVRKFFANIDHAVLMDILHGYIPDENIRWLLGEIVGSFSSVRPNIGLPLGNLTSQLLVNIYMNEFDQFMKHKIGAKYYIRYADDFVLLSENRGWLEQQIPVIAEFLREKLKLTLHPDKVFIKTFASGVDFLGWVHFPGHRVLRTATRRRALQRVRMNPKRETIDSYLGLLKHGNAHAITHEIIKIAGDFDS